MSETRKRILRWLAGVLLIFCVCYLGGSYVVFLRERITDQSMRSVLRDQTLAIAKALPVKDLKALTFSVDDHTNQAYARISAHIERYVSLLDYDGIYIFRPKDGQLLFGPDSYADDDPLSVASGTLYLRPPAALFDSVKMLTPCAIGPAADEYGMYVFGCAPSLDPASGKLLVEVCMTITADHWRNLVEQVERNTWLAVAVLALILLIGFTLCCLRCGASPALQRRLAHTEAVTILAAGFLANHALITAYLHDTVLKERTNFAHIAYLHADNLYTVAQNKPKNLERKIATMDDGTILSVLPYREIAAKAAEPSFVRGFLTRLTLKDSFEESAKETSGIDIKRHSVFFPLFIEDVTYVMAFKSVERIMDSLSPGSPLFTLSIAGFFFTFLLVLGVELFKRYRNRLILRIEKQSNALGKNIKHYNMLVENANAVTWSYNVMEDRYTFISPQVKAMLGYSVLDWLDHKSELFLQSIYADDRERFHKENLLLFQKEGTYTFSPFRLYRKDGRLAWVREIVTMEMEDGKPAWLNGVLFDISNEMLASVYTKRSIDFLSCLRSVYHLTLRPETRNAQLREVLDSFRKAIGCVYSLIAFTDETGKVTEVVNTPVDDLPSGKAVIDLLEKNEMPPCFRAALTSHTIFAISGHLAICRTCPFVTSEVNSLPEKLLIALWHGDRIFGIFYTKLNLNTPTDDLGKGIYLEFAAGLASALAACEAKGKP